MPASVVVLGKGSVAVRIAAWFQDGPDDRLWRIVPVVPEPSPTASLRRDFTHELGLQR